MYDLNFSYWFVDFDFNSPKHVLTTSAVIVAYIAHIVSLYICYLKNIFI